MTDEKIIVGVDTGGTFTDFVARIDGRLLTAKVLSTPDDPARAILEGLDRPATRSTWCTAPRWAPTPYWKARGRGSRS